MRLTATRRTWQWLLALCILPALVVVTHHVARGTQPEAVRTADELVATQAVLESLLVLGSATGSQYTELRDSLLTEGAAQLETAIRMNASRGVDWSVRLSSAIVLRWSKNPEECGAFHEWFEKVLKSSYGTVSGKPSSRAVAGLCGRHWREDHDDELLLLERLYKYKDPPHARSGIITVLGIMGTERSLGPLLELMKSDEHPSYSGVCAMAAAKISRRLGDTRAVRDIVTVYGKRQRLRGKGLPEEELQKMPPWPHVDFILALSHIGGKEAVKALEELQGAEADPVLIERLEETTQRVRERLESRQQEKDPGDKTDE